MSDPQLDLLRQYLAVIHDRFAILYHAVGNPTFAMDIEYKIDSTNQLAIKQARPWVSYVPTPANPVGSFNCDFVLFPNPAGDLINIGCENCGIAAVRIVDIKGSLVLEKTMEQAENWDPQISIAHLQNGLYFLSGSMNGSVCKTLRFIKH